MSWLQRLATRVDTIGAARKARQFSQGWPSRTSTDIRFFRSAKVAYRYRMQGDGPTIVFCADPPVTLELYDDLLAVFSPHYRVIVVELPGMGFSVAGGDFTFGWQETNDDVAQFLRAVAGDQATLAFSCVAGLAAVDIAVRFPELVSRLVLMQTGSVAAFARWKAARDPKQILAKPVIGQILMKRLAAKRMPDWYRLSVGNRKKLSAFCDCAAESLEQGALWSLASAYQVYMDPTIELDQPAQPILALWGQADRSHPADNAHTATTFSNDVAFKAFPELGHFLELEDPEAAFAAIHEFLENNP